MCGSADQYLVLYVDGSTAASEEPVVSLETGGDIDVIPVQTVSEATETLSTQDVDCIVSEYRLPDGDGLSFLDRVREADESVPFILYTADGSETIATRAFRNDVTDYVPREAATDRNTELRDRLMAALEGSAVDRERTEELRHLRQFKQAVFESDIAVNIIDAEGSLVGINEAAEEICGYSAAELDDGRWDLLYPDDEYRAEIVSAVTDVLQSNHGVLDFEATLTTKQGDERTVSWYAQPLVNKYDSVTGVVALGRDVTERRARKQELEELTTRLELALEETDTGIWERDLSTNEVFWDEACQQLFGYEPGEFPGEYEGFTRRVHDEDLPAVERAMQQAIESDSLYQADFRIELPDGEQRWIQSRGIVEYDADGEPDRMMGVETDITDRKTAEQAVEETKEYYRRIFQQSSDFVLIIDKEGTIEDVTPGIEHVLGYEPDELIGTDSFSLVHPDDRERLTGAMTDVLENPEASVDIEYRSRASDGSYRWLEARGNNHLDDPLLDGLVASVRDISQRKERQQQLEELTTRLELALEETDTGVWEWNLKTDEVFWDEACERLFGYDPGEFPETYEGFARRVPSADLTGVEQAVSEAIDTGQQYQADFRIERPDGEQRWLQSRGIVEYDEDGEPDRMVGVQTDITDRKEAKQAVEATKERYQRIFKLSPDYLTVVDEAGTITDITPGAEHVLGYDPDEMIGTNSFSHIHPDDRDRIAGVLAKVVENPEMDIDIEYRAETKNGSYRWMEARGNNHLDDPLLGGVVVNVRDITQRKERERELAQQTRQLKRKNEQLERLAQIISHDFQTPLSTAEKLTRLLRADLDDPASQVEQSLSDLEATHQRLREFADRLPRLARESTAVEGPTTCELQTVAESAWNVVDTGPLELRVESNRTLEADPERLQRAFENLFQNTVTHAVDAVSADADSQTATTVRVGALPEGFYIEDDGPGIRPAQRDELFEYGMGTGSGTGFGLAIVRTIIEAHGWTVSVAEPTTDGARFEIHTGKNG
jgi:PAS domain S-box-containing protein